MFARTLAVLMFVSGVQAATGGTLRVVDEAGRPIPKFQVMFLRADGGYSVFETGKDGKREVAENDVAAITRVIVRAKGYASALISVPGDERKEILTGRKAVVLEKGREVTLRLRMPEGVMFPADFRPEVCFEQQLHLVRKMRQPVNRTASPSFWDLDVGNAEKLGGDAFSIRLSEKSHPFLVAIHRPGFLQFFEAGPFTEKDIQEGVLEIDVPRPTGVSVIFDAGDAGMRDLPFESVQIDVAWRIPGNSTVCSVTNPRDKAAPALRLTDLAPGTYRVQVCTSPKARHATDPQTQVNVGRFVDFQDLALKAGEPQTVKFRYIPFDPQAFRGDRTAVVRLLNPDGAVARGEKLRIAYLDGHYGFLPVFDGLVPDSGEVELERLTDRLTTFAPKRRSYWVWLNDRHVGGFDLAAVAKPQRFEFQRALAVGDQAPNLEFIDIASGDRVPLTSLRGKIVLLELWATWCGPCQLAMRKLNELADAKKGDWKGRVALVAVSIDEAPELAAKHADQRGWTSLRHFWSQRSESDFQSNVERAFSVGGVPTAILLDANGKIVWYGHPVDVEPPLHERIEQLLSRSTAQ